MKKKTPLTTETKWPPTNNNNKPLLYPYNHFLNFPTTASKYMVCTEKKGKGAHEPKAQMAGAYPGFLNIKYA